MNLAESNRAVFAGVQLKVARSSATTGMACVIPISHILAELDSLGCIFVTDGIVNLTQLAPKSSVLCEIVCSGHSRSLILVPNKARIQLAVSELY